MSGSEGGRERGEDKHTHGELIIYGKRRRRRGKRVNVSLNTEEGCFALVELSLHCFIKSPASLAIEEMFGSSDEESVRKVGGKSGQLGPTRELFFLLRGWDKEGNGDSLSEEKSFFSLALPPFRLSLSLSLL